MISLGIVPSCTSFGFPIKNGSVTLIQDNKILLSVAEERLTGIKNAPGCEKGLQYVCENILHKNEPDFIAISTCCEPSINASEGKLKEAIPFATKIQKIPSHHLSHALSAYFTSPFDEAIICVIDCGGNIFEQATIPNQWWLAPREQASFYLGRGNDIKQIFSLFTQKMDWGIGEAYRAFTKYLGLGGQTASGKTMGLSAYGKKNRINSVLFERLKDGEVRSKLKLANPKAAINGVQNFFYKEGLHFSSRNIGEPIEQEHADIAEFIQRETQYAINHTVSFLVKKYQIGNICMSGGVALNCPTNTSLYNIKGVKSVHIPPCPGDDGQSLGNAIYPITNSGIKKNRYFLDCDHAFWGPTRAIGREGILSLTKKYKNLFEITEDNERYQTTAKMIASGKIVAWFQGRSEIGPRALGNRSILADPRKRENRIRLNHWIKGREPYRPYAASIIADEAHKWFDLYSENPFMLFLGKFKRSTESLASALYHPDKTCRVQTVMPKQKNYYNLLRSFQIQTGIPFLLNTSLNQAGFPIIESEEKAIDTVLQSDIDVAVINGIIFRKKEKWTKREFVNLNTRTIKWISENMMETYQFEFAEYQNKKRRYFGLLKEYCNWVLDGKKSTTIRYSKGCVDLPDKKFLNVLARPSGEFAFTVEIEDITILPFSSLTLDHAKKDGFDSLLALKKALKNFYGDIPDNHPITVYRIKPTS